MRICSRCHRTLSLDSFSQKREGYQPYCKDCNRRQKREWYARNQESELKKIKARKEADVARKRQFLVNYLKQHPCVDCGESDLVVLEFDHLRDKEADVAYLVKNASQARLEAEIEKCEVVCCNCHCRRTSKRNGSWRTAIGELV